MGRQASDLTFTASSFPLHHRHAGSVHLNVQKGNRFAHEDGQIELHGAIDLLLITVRNVCADGFCHALDGFGGDLQARQQLHLLAALIERRILAHQSLHAPHARRELRVNDVEFLIRRKLPLVAMRAQIIGTLHRGLAERGKDLLGTQFAIARLLSTGARNCALLRHGKPQQLGQGAGSGPLHGRTHQHLDGFQIEAAREDRAKQLLYLARNFALDSVRRFFSCGVRVSSTGRRRQIFSFTSTSSRPRRW